MYTHCTLTLVPIPCIIKQWTLYLLFLYLAYLNIVEYLLFLYLVYLNTVEYLLFLYHVYSCTLYSTYSFSTVHVCTYSSTLNTLYKVHSTSNFSAICLDGIMSVSGTIVNGVWHPLLPVFLARFWGYLEIQFFRSGLEFLHFSSSLISRRMMTFPLKMGWFELLTQ